MSSDGGQDRSGGRSKSDGNGTRPKLFVTSSLRRLFFQVNFLALAVVIGSLPEAGRVSSDKNRNHSGGRSKSRINYTRSKFRPTATSKCGSYKKQKGH
jgi:hypothetical protein